MRILGIETSCDETAVAVIEMSGSKIKPRIKILSNAVLSQIPLHRKFGGVVPHLAKREHEKNLTPILLIALEGAGLLHPKSKIANQKQILNSKFKILNSILAREPELLQHFLKGIQAIAPPRIDAIAVTAGPGLEPALWAGVNFARALSYFWKIPLVPVNHLEGHIYTALLGEKWESKRAFHPLVLKLPAFVLIVSGGHTELVLMKKIGAYKVIGETRDDAAGEAFDKVAKMLGLGYPGGPIISRLAERAAAQADVKQRSPSAPPAINITLPRPMLYSNDFDFSFSGLKTAVLYFLKDAEKKYSRASLRAPVAKEFQDAVTDVLIAKTVRAAKHYRVKSVVIGGGVAANALLRVRIAAAFKKELPAAALLLPSVRLTGDNALMIAFAGYFSRKKIPWRLLRADADLRLDNQG